MFQILYSGKLTPREFLQKFLRLNSESSHSLFKRPEVWHWSKNSIAKSVLIGLFIALLPLPCQMIIAALTSVYVGAYLPLSVALVWVSNPVTFIPLTWVCLSVGCNLLHIDMAILAELKSGNYWQLLEQYWQALLLGSVVSGLTLGLLGYYLTQWSWQFLAQVPLHPENKFTGIPSIRDK